MARFLPPFCPEHFPVLLDGDKGQDDEKGSAKRPKAKRLDLATWQLAWDRYTVAAIACEQISFGGCLRHKAVVMEVAADAAKTGLNPMLGVFYDQFARLLGAARCARSC